MMLRNRSALLLHTINDLAIPGQDQFSDRLHHPLLPHEQPNRQKPEMISGLQRFSFE